MEGDSLGAMEKVCRQLTYHLSPHSQWRRQGLLKRKPQACTIWPFKMDPAHASSPESCLERIKQTLQQHEARFPMAATEIQQATTTQAEGLAAVNLSGPTAHGGFQRSGCPPTASSCSGASRPRSRASASDVFIGGGERDINHLTGRAHLWGTAEWEQRTPTCASFQAFAAELRKVSGEQRLGPGATGGLLNISQGNRMVQDYTPLTSAPKPGLSDWNEPVRCNTFLRGLGEYLKDELVSYELPSSFDELVKLATYIDGHIQARR
ncbi:hypothetical protein L3Q82_005047 [Scortum barcoo]|uniref:Uncharacterized protein n=1 Tax=Scortum barcoo TaxID=214431 RepID=A0ACB8VDS7_9TELE|nr:hypothetical protein L3Q82_005047 [Scortum barcoo]